MRGQLQKALKRPVVLSRERRAQRVIRWGAKNRRTIFGLGLVGVTIASAATAGLTAAILGVAASTLPTVSLPAFIDPEILDSNPIILLDSAIKALLDIDDLDERLKRVVTAIKAKRDIDPKDTVELTAEDINPPTPTAATESTALAALAALARVRALPFGVQLGLSVIGGGILLLALTLIPEDIHTLMTRVASAILVAGAVIVGVTVANGNWRRVDAAPGSPFLRSESKTVS